MTYNQKQKAYVMKQYTQEEIDFLQKSLDGEDVQGRVPNGTELNDVVSMVNQGVLKVKPDDDFNMLCYQSYWSSNNRN